MLPRFRAHFLSPERDSPWMAAHAIALDKQSNNLCAFLKLNHSSFSFARFRY